MIKFEIAFDETGTIDLGFVDSLKAGTYLLSTEFTDKGIVKTIEQTTEYNMELTSDKKLQLVKLLLGNQAGFISTKEL